MRQPGRSGQIPLYGCLPLARRPASKLCQVRQEGGGTGWITVVRGTPRTRIGYWAWLGVPHQPRSPAPTGGCYASTTPIRESPTPTGSAKSRPPTPNSVHQPLMPGPPDDPSNALLKPAQKWLLGLPREAFSSANTPKPGPRSDGGFPSLAAAQISSLPSLLPPRKPTPAPPSPYAYPSHPPARGLYGSISPLAPMMGKPSASPATEHLATTVDPPEIYT